MELFFLCSILILFLSFPLASIFLLYRHIIIRNRNRNHNKVPPGKMGWPVVGESLEYISTRWKGHPEKFILDRLSKHAPNKVFKTSILGENMVVMCGASSHKFLFSNENKLVRSWWPSSVDRIFKSSTGTSMAEEGMKMRKLHVFEFLKLKVLQRYIPIMDSDARKHFSTDWEGMDEVEVYPLARRYTFSVTCRLLLGIEDLEYNTKFAIPFRDVLAGVFSIPIDFPGTRFHRAIKASDLLKKEVRNIIKQRKLDLLADDDGNGNGNGNGKAAANDILTHILLTPNEDGEDLSEVDLTNWIIGLLLGSHDSTRVVCTFIVKYLAELPHIYDAVYKEQMEILRSKASGELLDWNDIQKMKYSWNVACEVLRLTPFEGTFREAIVDFVYDGFQIPKGWKLHWNVNTTHKNPECFPEPEKFDPSRFEGDGPAPYTFVPFGGGPRMCPGLQFSKLVLLVFMHNLVKRFKWKKIHDDEQVVYNPLPMPTKGLPIRLYKHDGSDQTNAAA